jgi:hypothetical protein
MIWLEDSGEAGGIASARRHLLCELIERLTPDIRRGDGGLKSPPVAPLAQVRLYETDVSMADPVLYYLGGNCPLATGAAWAVVGA